MGQFFQNLLKVINILRMNYNGKFRQTMEMTDRKKVKLLTSKKKTHKSQVLGGTCSFKWGPNCIIRPKPIDIVTISFKSNVPSCELRERDLKATLHAQV